MSEAITSDNFHLSRPTTSHFGCADDGAPLSILSCRDPKILEFLKAATAPSTRRAYQSDLIHFLAHGGTIPATAEQVARYLADHASTHKMATLARRLAGVRSAHIERGFPDPTKNELIRLILRGIGRRFGHPQRRAAALTIDDLTAIVASLGQSTKDVRDAAILLIGFAGAFRRSELVTIDRDDVDIRRLQTLITIRRSKTDQLGQGRNVSIPRVKGPICPVAALEHWLKLAAIDEGPIFRRVTRGGTIQPVRLSADTVAVILKSRVGSIGGDPNQYSGHSLRAGFATEAARQGVPLWRIKAQTGHASDSTLERYIREDADQ
jgi:integrase